MSIIITEGFQLNSNLPIDSRFVVGATAYGSNPPPFYSNRNAIVYKYPGLRIWDFNDNVPYVWDGTQWINENTTGAIIQNASTGNTGYQNFITKFANNTTLLTKSLLFDDASNIGLGLTGSAILPNGVVSNTTGTPVNAINPPLSQNPYKPGLHVAGNIRTAQYFSGDGRYIININAYNINSGYLSLDRITPPNGLPSDIYMLKNTLGITSWDLVTNVIPVPGAQNTGSGTGIIYGGIISNTYQFKTLESLGLDITTGTQSINLESKPGVNIGNDTSSTKIYRFNNTTKIHEYFSLESLGLDITTGTQSINLESKPGVNIGNTSSTKIYRFNNTTKIHEYFSLKSNTLEISQEINSGNLTGNVMIEVPSNAFQFEVRDLIVNQTYIDTNFDSTGLGRLIMTGWAICNGQNGTPILDGIVRIGYGTNYNVITTGNSFVYGATGGSKDAVVVSHTHTFIGSEDNTPEPGNYICTNDDGSTGVQTSLSTTGVSGNNKNMQPYRVVLTIMKL